MPALRLTGSFVRIGEETDDNESRHFGDLGYDLASVNRSIYCDYDDVDKVDLRPRLAQAKA